MTLHRGRGSSALPKPAGVRGRLLCVFAFGCMLAGAGWLPAAAQVVVFEDAGVAAVATLAVPHEVLAEALPGAQFRSATELPEALSLKEARLLVLPYGAAFPEEDWQAIARFLGDGGNLLVLGGRAFTRPAYLAGGQRHLRAETYAFAGQLFLSEYQPVGASAGLSVVANAEAFEADPVVELPAFQWEQAYSVVIRLSDEASTARVGASGMPDSQLRALMWGIRNGHKIAAPVIEVDHFRNHFVGSRWVMLNCDGMQGFASAKEGRLLIAGLAQQALRGASRLQVIPSYPLYLPGEAPAFHVSWSQVAAAPRSAMLQLTVVQDGVKKSESAVPLDVGEFPLEQEVPLSTTFAPGFYTVTAQLECDGAPCGVYRTGFWVRDEAYLASGPRVSVDADFFEIDGKATPIMGTTYMASDAQRLFLRYPNPYVWDQDMQQISAAGMNMLRTGLWTDWDVATGGTGVANEHTLRTIEAFLMTARKYGLPVQFNLFAFMPEVFGGVNPYLDPESVRREREFVTSIAHRFRGVPFLMWDLINEPSFDNPQHFFNTKANGDAAELRAWNEWLLARYGRRENVAALWNIPLQPGPLPVPDDADFQAKSSAPDGRTLSVYDFDRFTQETFTGWVGEMRDAIRAAGSQQMATVGQDEGGGLTSPAPAYFGTAVDFTTMHSWWFNDDLVWDSLVAKQRGKPMLVQETGVQFEADLRGKPRRTAPEDAVLLERKLAIAMGTGAGAIEWLWNTNALMKSQQEVTIGAVRWDGTEKPEAAVLRAFGSFAAAAGPYVKSPVERNDVVILTSQALQYSALSSFAISAQERAVRVLNYACHVPTSVVAENHVDDIAGSRLVVSPSPQALGDSAWARLLGYVEGGGNLLITGPVERNDHWQTVQRLAPLGVDVHTLPMSMREDRIDLGDAIVEATYSQAVQQHLEIWRTDDGRHALEIRHGKGMIFLVSSPVELSESPAATKEVYLHVLKRIGYEPEFTVSGALDSILIRPERMEGAVLYLLVSETDHEAHFTLQDREITSPLTVDLPAGRAKLILVKKGSGRVLASYQPAPLLP